MLPLFSLAYPEIFLLIMICILMLVDGFFRKKHPLVVGLLVNVTLIIVVVLLVPLFFHKATVTFHHHFILNHMAVLIKLLMVSCVFVILLYSRQYLIQYKIPYSEFHMLALVSLLGGMVIASANSLLTLYLGLEMLSLPLYAMVAMSREDKTGAEAAMKYFVMGALASGILLYGFSLIYGQTSSLFLPQIAQTILNHSMPDKVSIFALVFVVVAIAFKLGAVPFHMWLPDVYEGAPTPVAAIISSVPKLAAFVLLVRTVVQTMPSLAIDWQPMFQILAILSLFLGNVVALVQTSIKRLFAYSAISHVGFILLVLSLLHTHAQATALFYILTYAITVAGGFGVIILLSSKGVKADNIHDFTGLNSTDRWLAFMMLIILFSMAGIPPFVGFDAKLFVLGDLVKQHHYYLAIYALIMTVIGAFYYIRIIKLMYFDQPRHSTPIAIAMDSRVFIGINGLLLLVLGMFPAMLMSFCRLSFGG